MYQQHFGLERPPFKITPDTSLFYEGNQRGAALDALTYAINSGEGIIKVVGEVGTGKTMLCRMLEVRLSGDIDVVYIANPSLSPDNILHVIAHEMHLDVSNDMSKVDVMQQIQAHLLKKHAANRQVVLFVEEAQSMPLETLEEIRLLSNLETDQNKLLQMVLFGQPELDEKLAQPQIRQLKERITHSFYLAPFPPDDTLHYLNFRLRAVGYTGPDVFTRKTAKVVKKYSNGLTRRINIIADKSMLAAFSEGSYSITPSHVKSAAQDSEFTPTGSSNKWLWMMAGILLLIAALFAGFYMGQQDMAVPVPGVKPIATQDKAASETVAAVSPPPQTEQQAVQAEGEAEQVTGEAVPVEAEPAAEETPVMVSPADIPADDVVVSAEGAPVMAARNDIAGKLEVTRQWLQNTPHRYYSIQLFMARTSNADELEAFLQDIPEMLDFTKIYIYETVISGRGWYGVVYDEYPSYDEAIQVLNTLPESLQASEPYLRRISALRSDAAKSSAETI